MPGMGGGGVPGAPGMPGVPGVPGMGANGQFDPAMMQQIMLDPMVQQVNCVVIGVVWRTSPPPLPHVVLLCTTGMQHLFF